MRSLAGKTIPMWIDDPTGEERRQNPKAKTRRTKSGKIQVLIFRRAAKIGARKQVRRAVGGVVHNVSVPASYPGAPGRITRRHGERGSSRGEHQPGGIRRFNTGVRWRHPGLAPRGFLHYGLTRSGALHRVNVGRIEAKIAGA
jgi:hypothetical protein